MMNVASTSSSVDVAAIWNRKIQAYGNVDDVGDSLDALLAHLHGQALTSSQTTALQILSPPTRSVLAIQATPRLATDARALIEGEAQQLYHDSTGALAKISGIYSRWQECLQLLGK
jgi:hypothetical protein